MPWLPSGSGFHMAHGRGVARLNHSWVGQLSWVEARTNQSHGCAPYFLPVSHRHPTGGSPSAKRFVDIKGYQVSHNVKARPCQCVGHGLPRDHQVTLGGLMLVKPLHLRTATDG